MTIQEAIEVFNKPAKHIGLYNGELTYSAELVRAFETAIRSLEAWEKVNEEIKGLDWNGDDAYWYGVSDVSAIIDKHLGEVTECK